MLEFVPYTREWTGSVREFNRRMLAGGLESELCFPEEPDPVSHAGSDEPLSRQYFLAMEESNVRGAYFLTHEHWASNGEHHRVANFRLPLSEGFVNPRYKGTGRALLSHALETSPLLYCLGLGDKKRPLPQMLIGQNWPIVETAFYFRCVHPREVLRDLAWLRTNPGRRLAMDAAAQSGGWLGIAALQRLRTQQPSRQTAVSTVTDFEPWADELWHQARGAYSILADRSSRALRVRYPASDTRFVRLRISSGSTTCGWAVVLATAMQDHRHFGKLKVGTIVDCLALPGDEHEVIHAATRILEERGVDLIVSNQSHRSWRTAFERSGYLAGPTNRFFTPSPELTRLLHPLDQKFPLTHLTRGDGAGPIHL
jgi:hypothetical protein